MVLGGAVALGGAQPAVAQSNDRDRGRQALVQLGREGGAPSSLPPGTGVPSWAEPDLSPPSYEQTSPGGYRPKAAPGVPEDDPNNVPFGGAEWLAAAGAAYAVRRLSQSDASDA